MSDENKHERGRSFSSFLGGTWEMVARVAAMSGELAISSGYMVVAIRSVVPLVPAHESHARKNMFAITTSGEGAPHQFCCIS